MHAPSLSLEDLLPSRPPSLGPSSSLPTPPGSPPFSRPTLSPSFFFSLFFFFLPVFMCRLLLLGLVSPLTLSFPRSEAASPGVPSHTSPPRPLPLFPLPLVLSCCSLLYLFSFLLSLSSLSSVFSSPLHSFSSISPLFIFPHYCVSFPLAFASPLSLCPLLSPSVRSFPNVRDVMLLLFLLTGCSAASFSLSSRGPLLPLSPTSLFRHLLSPFYLRLFSFSFLILARFLLIARTVSCVRSELVASVRALPSFESPSIWLPSQVFVQGRGESGISPLEVQ